MALRVFTAFSGYDSQCMALDLIGIDYELVGWSEIDKNAIIAHNAVYPQYAERNYGDISKIDWSKVPNFDLFTYSSPCQDFSQAGRQAGGAKGSGTRSSLLWECERAIDAKRPKYLLMENVAALVSDKFVRLFNEWQLTLERLGYTNFTQVLNAKTHGYPEPIPQNRERVFMVSILNCDQAFYFPDETQLQTRLKDVLEDKVDERYYLKCETIEGIMPKETEPLNEYEEGIARTIKAQYMQTSRANFIRHDGLAATGVVTPAEPTVLGLVRDEKGNVVKRPPVEVANTVTSGKRDNTQNYVLIPQATKTGYIPMELGGVCDLSYPTSKLRRGRVQEGGTVSPTLLCGCENALRRIETDYRIRKLTERECFRLMGVSESDIDKIQAAGISRSQQYKMAGNSIVVNCLASIFYQLLIGNKNKHQQLQIF